MRNKDSLFLVLEITLVLAIKTDKITAFGKVPF